ncbi:MAG: hypothetical protein R3B06_12070 [Kofleriaceae bacterium]
MFGEHVDHLISVELQHDAGGAGDGALAHSRRGQHASQAQHRAGASRSAPVVEHALGHDQREAVAVALGRDLVVDRHGPRAGPLGQDQQGRRRDHPEDLGGGQRLDPSEEVHRRVTSAPGSSSGWR